MSDVTKFTPPFRLILSNWSLLYKAAAAEVQQKNAGSALGNWWLLLSPCILLSIYTLVYLYIFRLQPANMTVGEYILHIFAGLIPFLALSEGIQVGLGSLESNRALLKTTMFPLEILSVKTVMALLPGFLAGLGLVILTAIFLKRVTFAILLVPVVVFCQCLFVIGLSWILSLLSIIVKDVRNLTAYLLMTLMILSPIAYTMDMLPKVLSFIVWMNPIAFFIVCYQYLIGLGRLPPMPMLPLTIGVSVAVFFIGYHFFHRMKVVVANYA